MTDFHPKRENRPAGERAAADHLIMIKAHLVSLGIFLKGADEPFGPMSIVGLRHAYGDIRMVIEELMLMSVSAHKTAGEEVSRKLRTEYQAVNKMRLLRSINPRFFPVAIEIIPSDEPGIQGKFVAVSEECLTEEHVKSYYGKCGDSLHANSKLTSVDAYREEVLQVRRFLKLVARLLNTFEIDISGQGYIMLGHLNLDEPGFPRMFLARHASDDNSAVRSFA